MDLCLSMKEIKTKISSILNTFSFKQWLLFYGTILILAITLISMLYQLEKSKMLEVPLSGSTYTEGLVGSPRFINPVMAITDTDKDLSYLIFSGLFKKTISGSIEPMLAEKYTISEDGLTYTISLKNNITFHNGDKFSADDVVYTIKQIQDPLTKSPRENSWKGITINKIDDYTLEFKLKQKFGDFLQLLTVGILSQKQWSNLSPEKFTLSDNNIHPTGTGPYAISSVKKDRDNIPSEIILKRNKKYSASKPYIEKIKFFFYNNEKSAINAFNKKTIMSLENISIANTSLIEKKSSIEINPLPRFFGIFLNKNQQPLFRDTNILTALNMYIPKRELVNTLLGSYAKPVESPILIGQKELNTPDTFDPGKADEILKKDGWEKDTNGTWVKGKENISFKLITSDIEELKNIAFFIRDSLKKEGVLVTVEIYDQGSLTQNIITPRNYDALLFGEEVRTPSNLFTYWHSSERMSPGFNLSMYTNVSVDKYLEDLKKESDSEKKDILIEKIKKEIDLDKPIIPLFQSMRISATHENIFNKAISRDITSHRFSDIEQWSIKKDYLWPFITKINKTQ